MGYIGMCHCEGYGFQAVYSRIGYINQSVWVQNRVSFFRKLISWLKILRYKVLFWLDCASDLSTFWKTATLGQGGIQGVQSSTGQQNSADLALVYKDKGSRVPAVRLHPKIPKVLPLPSYFCRSLRQVPPPPSQTHLVFTNHYVPWNNTFINACYTSYHECNVMQNLPYAFSTNLFLAPLSKRPGLNMLVFGYCIFFKDSST